MHFGRRHLRVQVHRLYGLIRMGETHYVDEMLDYIHEIWLQFFPDDFLKKGGLPYRVFLADSIYWDRSAVSPGW